MAIGRDRSDDLAATYPQGQQVIWTEMLEFIWERFRRYRNQKAQVDQWDDDGKFIKRLADGSHNAGEFRIRALTLIGAGE